MSPNCRAGVRSCQQKVLAGVRLRYGAEKLNCGCELVTSSDECGGHLLIHSQFDAVHATAGLRITAGPGHVVHRKRGPGDMARGEAGTVLHCVRHARAQLPCPQHGHIVVVHGHARSTGAKAVTGQHQSCRALRPAHSTEASEGVWRDGGAPSGPHQRQTQREGEMKGVVESRGRDGVRKNGVRAVDFTARVRHTQGQVTGADLAT